MSLLHQKEAHGNPAGGMEAECTGIARKFGVQLAAGNRTVRYLTTLTEALFDASEHVPRSGAFPLFCSFFRVPGSLFSLQDMKYIIHTDF